MDRTQITLIREALNAAEANLKLARNLFDQLDSSNSNIGNKNRFDNDKRIGKDNHWEKRNNSGISVSSPNKSFPSEFEEIVGKFNGLELVTDAGKKYIVPKNYISKSLIVEGDVLKMVKENGEEKFKQIRRVKRKRYLGTIAKKDGELMVVTEVGHFQILPESISHYALKENDKVNVFISEGVKKPMWAVIEEKLSLEEVALKEEKRIVSKDKVKEKFQKEETVDNFPANEQVIYEEHKIETEEKKEKIIDEEALQ